MADITLTDEQQQAVISDMDRKVDMLSKEEVEALATKLNDEVDIPFVGDDAEQVIFVKTVMLFDRLLYQNLPNELYGLVKNTTDGISADDAKQLKSVLGTRLNKKFDLPYIPEWVEQKIFETLLDLLVEAMTIDHSVLD